MNITREAELQRNKEGKSLELRDFGTAIRALKNNYRVAREGWNGKGMYLELQKPKENSRMTLPYIFMKTVQGDLVPWLASQTDMLSEDWTVVNNVESVTDKKVG